MNRIRVFLDSCVFIEGLCAPWSASRGVLILGRSALFTFVLADIVLEETERALTRKLGEGYGADGRLAEDLSFLLRRVDVERAPHVSRQEFHDASKWIRHRNDIPVLAAAVKAKPDWLLTDNTAHFTATVSRKTAVRIATPAEFLDQCGRIFT